MGSRSAGVRLLVCLALGLGVTGACSPLYGSKPEKLKNPEKRKKPPEVVEAGPQITYVDDCNANFSDELPVLIARILVALVTWILHAAGTASAQMVAGRMARSRMT